MRLRSSYMYYSGVRICLIICQQGNISLPRDISSRDPSTSRGRRPSRALRCAPLACAHAYGHHGGERTAQNGSGIATQQPGRCANHGFHGVRNARRADPTHCPCTDVAADEPGSGAPSSRKSSRTRSARNSPSAGRMSHPDSPSLCTCSRACAQSCVVQGDQGVWWSRARTPNYGGPPRRGARHAAACPPPQARGAVLVLTQRMGRV